MGDYGRGVDTDLCDETEYLGTVEAVQPAAPRIDLPVYFLCGPKTMSWGETVLMLVKGYRLGTVIGTPTNGDATTFILPAFPFGMTAIKAVNLDGSRHHGIGVQPDILTEAGSCEEAVRLIGNHLLQ